MNRDDVETSTNYAILNRLDQEVGVGCGKCNMNNSWGDVDAVRE